MIHRMEELVRRIDADLYKHLENENLVFMQFAFRWMNCLLMRELSLNSTVRLWDTYLAESGNGFDAFHICMHIVPGPLVESAERKTISRINYIFAAFANAELD